MKDKYNETMINQPTASAGFAKAYEGNPPWDIGRPQPPFVAIADQVASPLLDAGCATGGTFVFFAARGVRVTGIDFVEEAIRRARARAANCGLSVEFLTKDAMTLAGWDRQFATVIDSGLFHVYSGDDRRRYVRGLAHVLKPGGRLYLFSFNDAASWPGGGVSKQDLHDAFADGWNFESLELAQGEMNPAFVAEHPDALPKDGKMWFAVIRRDP